MPASVPISAAALMNESETPAGVAGTTITQYVLRQAGLRLAAMGGRPSSQSQEGVSDLITLLNSITLAVKTVGAQVRSAGLPGYFGEYGANPRAMASALNDKANSIWMDSLLYSKKSCVLVSEDLAEPIVVQEGMQGEYAVVFDPLTGLSDPPSQHMGAIFGVFHQLGGAEQAGLSDVLQPARNLIAAGYALYGSCTALMFSMGAGVHHFTLDAALNEFIMTAPDVRIPYFGATYSINEGYVNEFAKETRDMLACMKNEPALDGKRRTCRYIGSMVADVHRTLLKGGIFMYPQHERGFPNGRLKLLYEAGPMAFLITQAGGQASSGTQKIIDMVPEAIHQRVPVFIGSPDEVALAISFYDKKAPWGGNFNDPMYKLRRQKSIERQNSPRIGDRAPDEDGIICYHLG